MLHDTAMSPDIVTACGQTNTRRKYLERVLVCVNCVKPCTSLEHAFFFRYFEFSVLAMLLFRVSLLSLRTRLNFCLSCVVNIEFGIRFWHWMSKKYRLEPNDGYWHMHVTFQLGAGLSLKLFFLVVELTSIMTLGRLMFQLSDSLTWTPQEREKFNESSGFEHTNGISRLPMCWNRRLDRAMQNEATFAMGMKMPMNLLCVVS